MNGGCAYVTAFSWPQQNYITENKYMYTVVNYLTKTHLYKACSFLVELNA
jgi:hypothetical protein